MKKQELKKLLNQKVDFYNQPSFIKDDPICIPHLFTQKQDIEIAGFFAAIFAWGNRTTIINKSKELMLLMEMQPHQFCLNHNSHRLKRLAGFKHRTFTADDLYYFVEFFHQHYSKHESLETAFFPRKGMTVEEGLNHFKNYFFSFEHLKRTEKHISSPKQKSSCKRLNMYLRWMVRNDNKAVDFGIWQNISAAELICPLDVHVSRIARQYGLLHRKQDDWEAALELTANLRILDKQDPVKYDFALFGTGVMETKR
ncbi:TIGR02757 family protein [Lacibacter luteus]|uniref:TIGR02757 family protein n=1 Tax=Lacibacter luteus TaxID=2508719 RepID=A0A4Q1CKN0_9BACT|nr:TIGR02757 family protein [Lacibacter luteus]RXK60938.1 TIGR02757 family protein [Lacibacter luteus]